MRFIVATPVGAAAPSGTLDGKPLAFSRLTFADSWVTPGRLKATAALVGDDRAATALWVAQVSLSPGARTAAVGGRKIEVWGVKGPVPAGWARAYAHSAVGGDGKPDCAGCHEQKGDALGAAVTPGACEACHDEVSVQLAHRHVAGPLAKCALCHDPHGAARPKLLVDAKEKLCSKCHESGHSKE